MNIVVNNQRPPYMMLAIRSLNTARLVQVTIQCASSVLKILLILRNCKTAPIGFLNNNDKELEKNCPLQKAMEHINKLPIELER